MSHKMNRAAPLAGCSGDHPGNLLRDFGNARVRAEFVRWHDDGEATLERPPGEVRPERLIELHPEAAMNEGDEATRWTDGQEHVVSVALIRPVADIRP